MPSAAAFRRLPRVAQTDALWAATGLIVCATLGAWLVYWLAFVRPEIHFAAISPDPGPPVAVATLAALHPGNFGTAPARPTTVPRLRSVADVEEYLVRNR